MNFKLKQRTIMIFPKFNNIKVINEIREKYDPLFNHVNPHISLVFTFESNLSTIEVKNHLIKVLTNIKPFKLNMGNIIKVDNSLGKFLFLEINEGTVEIKEISSKLYTDILKQYKPEWLNDNTFLPHMTIGSFNSSDELNNAYLVVQKVKYNFETIVNRISVEVIDENEDSIIEVEIDL